MSLETTFPFLYNYWPHVVALVVSYAIAVYFIKAKESDKKADDKNGKISTGKDKGETKRKKYISPDQAAEIKEEEPDDEGDVVSALPQNLPHVPLTTFLKWTEDQMIDRSQKFYEEMNRRRTCRFFSTENVPKRVMENIIKTAGTSPSGAHTEPWTFVVVSDKDLKSSIRQVVEEEEEINYNKRMGVTWTTDLQPIMVHDKDMRYSKPYLTDAPYLILVFKQTYGWTEDGRKKNHYYHEISVAIATGILLSAIQNAGLVTLTSTPLNCGPAVRTLLGRPNNEKLMVLLPVGYPSEDCTVPDFKRKPLDEISVWL